MLKELILQDFLFVEYVELDFDKGLNVITGETGAGKSLLLEGIKLILGKKAKSGLVKNRKNITKIHAIFDVSRQNNVIEILKNYDLLDSDSPNILSITRTLKQEGSDKIFVNGILTNLSVIKELGKHLIEIHGQNEHQTLLLPDIQLELLDRYGGINHQQNTFEAKKIYLELKKLKNELESIEKQKKYNISRLAELEESIQTIENLNLSDKHELSNLQQEAKLLANLEKIAKNLISIRNLIDGVDDTIGVFQAVKKVKDQVSEIAQYYENAQGLVNKINTIYLELADFSHEISKLADKIEFDPERLNYLNERIANIDRVCRRFNTNFEGLFETLENLKNEYSYLTAPDFKIDALQDKINKLEVEFNVIINKISTERKKLAEQLKNDIMKSLDGLGFGRVEFEIRLNKIEPSAIGAESVEFLVSLNPGVEPEPLKKVASGGELSRLALAIKQVLAQADELPTLLFDEIDTGIGGKTAETVANKLHDLSKHKQIILVTHLHQIAKEADAHFVVEKKYKSNDTIVEIKKISGQQREVEIARMIGNTDQKTQEFAKKLLEEVYNKKSQNFISK